jgi:hypothetical protein
VALSRCRGLDAFAENGAASEIPTFRPAPRAGHRLESFAWLERLEDYAVKHGLDRLLAYALLDQLRRHLLGDELIAAEEDSARLEAVAARLPDDAQAALGEIAEVAERAHRPGDRAHARPRARAGRTSKAMLGMDDARSPTRPGASAENFGIRPASRAGTAQTGSNLELELAAVSPDRHRRLDPREAAKAPEMNHDRHTGSRIQIHVQRPGVCAPDRAPGGLQAWVFRHVGDRLAIGAEVLVRLGGRRPGTLLSIDLLLDSAQLLIDLVGRMLRWFDVRGVLGSHGSCCLVDGPRNAVRPSSWNDSIRATLPRPCGGARYGDQRIAVRPAPKSIRMSGFSAPSKIFQRILSLQECVPLGCAR